MDIALRGDDQLIIAGNVRSSVAGVDAAYSIVIEYNYVADTITRAKRLKHPDGLHLSLSRVEKLQTEAGYYFAGKSDRTGGGFVQLLLVKTDGELDACGDIVLEHATGVHTSIPQIIETQENEIITVGSPRVTTGSPSVDISVMNVTSVMANQAVCRFKEVADVAAIEPTDSGNECGCSAHGQCNQDNGACLCDGEHGGAYC